MVVDHVVLAGLWLLYGLLHSLLVAPGVKERMMRRMGKHFSYYRLYYNIFSLAGLIAIVVYQLSLPRVMLFSTNIFLQAAGALVSLGGLVLMAHCIKKYFFTLSGIKTLVKESEPESDVLMITGIHRYVRHPLYLGTFLFTWGLLPVFPCLSLLVMNVAITAYTLVGIQLEEKKLIAAFGADYIKYQQTVPKIIPRPWFIFK